MSYSDSMTICELKDEDNCISVILLDIHVIL